MIKVMHISTNRIIEVDETHYDNVLKNNGYINIDDIEEPALKPKVLIVAPEKRKPGRPKKS